MKLLVTGVCGFIDSNFVRYMQRKYSNYQITNFGKLTDSGNPANLKDFENNPDFSSVQENICNSAIVNKVMKKINLIVHFTVKIYVDRSIRDGQISARTNVLGTDTLLTDILLEDELANKNLGEKIHVFFN